MRGEGMKLTTPSPQRSGKSRSRASEEGSVPRRRGGVEDEDDENDRIVLDSFLHWEAEESGSINFQHMLQKVL